MERSPSVGSLDRFAYFTEIPSLQEIAAYQIALEMRYKDHSRQYFDPDESQFGFFYKREYHSYYLQVKSLTIPSAIKEMINNCLDNIEEELFSWLNHFDCILYARSRTPYKVHPVDINWCVWLPNGQIDYFKTGLKMLRSEKLDQRQKFLIMCEYCMEDEIKKVSLDTLPTDYIEDTCAENYHDDGILLYWLHFLKNTLHELPLYNYASPEVAMAKNFRRYARFAVEYFWHRIGAYDQLILVSEWIARRCYNQFECTAIERLISAMSWPQQRSLLEQSCEEMLINISLHSRSTRCSLWVWKYCKDTIPDEQFVRVVGGILSQWQDYSNHCSALIEIWETASNHQRSLAASSLLKMIINMCLFRNEPSMMALEFLNKFLPLISTEDKKKVILQLATKIKSNSIHLSTLDKILDACLPSFDEKLTFMKSVIESNEMKIHCLNYIHERDFRKLNEVLEYFFCRDVEEARAYKKNLLESMEFEEWHSIDFICKDDEWLRFEKYIDEIFSNDPEQAMKEKQRLIKLAVISASYRYLFTLRRDVQQTMKIIEMMFANEELKSIKREFACSFGESLKTKTYWENGMGSDGTYFRGIVDWCLGDDDEAILEFKEQVSSNTIFDRIFCRINGVYSAFGKNSEFLEALLEHLNKFLEWYFASVDEVKLFKVARLNVSFEQMRIFRSISERKDEQMLDVLLKWFFHGDDEQIRQFRSENFEF